VRKNNDFAEQADGKELNAHDHQQTPHDEEWTPCKSFPAQELKHNRNNRNQPSRTN